MILRHLSSLSTTAPDPHEAFETRIDSVPCSLHSSHWCFSASVQSATLDEVEARGAVRCGVNVGLTGFAKANSLGEYEGFDIDVCRAIASALFNDSEAVEMIPLTSTERFAVLQQGAIDVLSRNTTWTLERNSLYGDFAGVNFYDGQGFMVTKRSGIRSALELDNLPICVSPWHHLRSQCCRLFHRE